MKLFIFGSLYIAFIVVVSCLIPTIMIPIFRDLDLGSRDAVGYSLVVTLISDMVLIGFGIIIWTEQS